MFTETSKRAGPSTLVVITLALFAAAQAGAGTIVTVVSQAPNWALGSPQFATLGGC